MTSPIGWMKGACNGNTQYILQRQSIILITKISLSGPLWGLYKTIAIRRDLKFYLGGGDLRSILVPTKTIHTSKRCKLILSPPASYYTVFIVLIAYL